LDHFREEYRNPVTHPEEVVDDQTAFNLFPAALSAISQMLVAIQEIEAAKQKAKEEQLALKAAQVDPDLISLEEIQPVDQPSELAIVPAPPKKTAS
jgi:hypothetical protein